MSKVARLNVQGLSRRDKGLMSCILPDTNYTVASIDLSAGEPTVTSHFSRDPNYLWATFDGVGKAPEYRNGTLMIDDIYLMTMSVSPLGREKIADAFHNGRFKNGLTFTEAWLLDPEIIKSHFKEERKVHKILALGLGYGMGAEKMCKQMYDNGYTLDLKTAKDFKYAYWNLFSGVKAFSHRLSKIVESKGYIINPFGYRLSPDPHKAFNYYIQSSVSGIMHVYGIKIFAAAPYVKFITCIHDEFLLAVPNDKLEQFRIDKDFATKSLNDDLKWSVEIRTGLVYGNNWYEAK